MNFLKKTARSGKLRKGNKRQQSYINFSVLVGFILLFVWVQLYKRTFIDIEIVLALIIFPSLLASFFLFKKYSTVCGYAPFLVGNITYNILIRIMVFILIAMPIGNLVAITFLSSNQILSSDETHKIVITPEVIFESTTKRGVKYTLYAISQYGVTKKLRSYDKSATEIQNSQLELKIRNGFLGYNYYQGYVLKDFTNKW